jgi:tricorn protease
MPVPYWVQVFLKPTESVRLKWIKFYQIGAKWGKVLLLKKKRFLLFFFFLTFWGELLNAESLQYARYPALSPTARFISFSYAGDLFRVPSSGGEATRLTHHPAYDGVSYWSPDGRFICFESKRQGNTDLFRLDLHSGAVRALTFFQTDERLCGFTPDARFVLFTAISEQSYPHRPLLYKIPVEGGTPEVALKDFCAFGAYDLKGESLFYIRHEFPWWQQGYQGSLNQDIFSYSLASRTSYSCTNDPHHDRFPLPLSSKHFYYLSEQAGVFNLFEWNAGVSLQKTQHDTPIFFASLNAQGSHIVYTSGSQIYLYSLASQTSSIVSIHPFLGERREEAPPLRSPVEDFEVSEDQEHFLIQKRGDLFAFAPPYLLEGTPLMQQVSQEQFPQWGKKAVSAYGITSAVGSSPLLEIRAEDQISPLSLKPPLVFKRLPLLKPLQYLSHLSRSPQGNKLAFLSRNQILVVYDLKTQQEEQIATHEEISSFCWSPDSEWIAYSAHNSDWNFDIFIIPSEGGTPFNLSDHPAQDRAPAWSPDGTRLAFLSTRQGKEEELFLAILDKNFYESSPESEWRADLLRRSTPPPSKSSLSASPSRKKIPISFQEDPQMKPPLQTSPSPPTDPTTTPTRTSVPFQIHFEDLDQRILQITSQGGGKDEPVWSPQGEGIFFTAEIHWTLPLSQENREQRDLFFVSLDPVKIKRVTQGGKNPQKVQRVGSILYFLSQGVLFRTPFQFEEKELKVQVLEPLFFEGRSAYPLSEWHEQIFSEVWQAVDQYFYDPQFAGKAWYALGWKYASRVPFVQTSEDFADLVLELCGELGVSHFDYRLAPSVQGVSAGTGLLGIRYEKTPDGLMIVGATPRGPCDQGEPCVIFGEILKGIDGHLLSPQDNFYEFLQGKAEKEVELLLSNEGQLRRIRVRPLKWEQFLALEYQAYRKRNQTTVQRYSKGALAYVHLDQMTPLRFQEFQQRLYQQSSSAQGLLLDLRENQGGWYADYFLSALTLPEHASIDPHQLKSLSIRRPFYSWSKPLFLLCNEYTFSNAEIFAHGIQQIKRGTLLGKPHGGSSPFGKMVCTE